MSISNFAVKRPVTTYMFFFLILLLGLVSVTRLAVDLLPEIEFPSISVNTTYTGVGPEEIETLITRPLEEALSSVQGLNKLESFSAEGVSRISLQFLWGVTLDSALNDVRAVVDRVKARLPDDADTPVVFKFDMSSFPIMFLTLSGDMEPRRLTRMAEETIKYRLERVEGVASADVRGGMRREIHVNLQKDRLLSFGITASQVSTALRRENVNLPGGNSLDDGTEIIVRTLGEFKTIADIEKVIVDVKNGLPIRVIDLATVTDSVEDPINAVYIDGQPGIRLAVTKLPGANTVDVADKVHKEVEAINQDISNILLRARFDTSDYIRDSISNLRDGVLFGAILAIFVLFLFLRRVRATVIIATSIPIAAIGTFALMYVGGLTLNMISFGGLALGIGMLVDNAIVVLENIQRYKDKGLPPKEASVRGSNEVALPITASTLTTLSIFIPVIFIEGFAGIFFGQMAAVVSFALICSLAVALMLVPVLASKGSIKLKTLKEESPAQVKKKGFYETLLAKALKYPKTVLTLAVFILAGSLFLYPLIGSELMPEGDQGEIRIDGELALGTPLEQTSKIILDLEQKIRASVEEVDTIMSVAGSPGPWSRAGKNGISIRISLVEDKNRTRSADEIASALRPLVGRVPGFSARVRAGEQFWLFRMLRGGGERISIDIRGFDNLIAQDLARQTSDLIQNITGIEDVDVDRKPGGLEALVLIDRDKAADMGFFVGEVADVISTYVLGDRATYFRDGGDEFTVLVRLAEEDRKTSDTFESFPLINSSGTVVRLGEIAQIVKSDAPVSIKRVNQERVITVSAGFADRDLGSIMADIREAVDTIEKPYGFEIIIGGELEEQQKTFMQLLLGFVLAIILVYMVMAALFESFVHPFIMLFSIPFAAIGILITLVVTDTTLNVFSFLGVIVLIGVVVNNAIVLVDYININRREKNMSLYDAVIVSAKRRLRPILMTTFTTSLALLPTALGLAEGSQMQAPLARVVVGGLVSSALITLVFIPTFYYQVEGFRQRLGFKI